MHTVTGATGLVGAHLTYRLLKEDQRVRVIHRSSSDLSFIKKVIAYYDKDPLALFEKIEFAEADLLDVPALSEALVGTEILYHCAAMVSFAPKYKKVLLEDNPDMTANIVNLALELGVKKLVHVSSVAALGRKANQTRFNEDSHWVESKENSNYGKGKYRAELEVWRGIQEGLPAVIVSPTIILGPGHWTSGSASLFHNIAKGFNFYTTGVNGFVDVRDLVEVMLQLRNQDVTNERFIVVAENRSYQEVFNLIADALEVKRPKREIKPWMSGIAWRLEKLRTTLFGGKPLVTKETARTAQQEYYYNNQKLLNTLNFKFSPLEKSVADFANMYKQDHKA